MPATADVFDSCASSPAILVAGAPIWRSHRADDVDEHAQQLTCWDLSYDQLGAGRFNARFFDVNLPGVQVFCESTNQAVRQRGGLGAGRLGMAFVRRGRGEGACGGQTFGPGALLACHEATLDLRTPAVCELAGVVLAPELLEATAPDARREPLPAVAQALSEQAPAAHRLHQLVLDSLVVARRLAHRAAQGLGSRSHWPDALALQQWRDDLLDASLAALQQAPVVGDPLRAQRRSQLVERACALMLEQVEQLQSVSQAELCRSLGTSQRNLGYAFQSVLGLSPLAWLRVVRLNAVRRSLRQSALHHANDSPESIYDVATRHGFWHFGRFSVEYRQHFGERPSDTLRRYAPSPRAFAKSG